MSEREDAASYWANRKLGAFSKPRPWSKTLAQRIASYQPASVFEFGCNVGRHLQAVREQLPEARIVGMDIHLPAVQAARHHGLAVMLGDELSLSLIPDRGVDVAFTVSVIDHLPSPAQALYELDRLATLLVLVEPWLGHEAKLADTGTSPWTYSWDYARRLPHRTWQVEPFPLHDKGAGPHYQLHIGS